MILYNHPLKILRYTQNDISTTYLGGTDGGEAAISASHHARSIVILSAAKNPLGLIMEDH